MLKAKSYVLVAAAFFAMVAVLHLLRIFYGWFAVIGGAVIPMWASWAALVIAAYLAYVGFNLARGEK